jgi:pimeloyl-ACP methyl ester carboxylesterase
MPDFPGSKMVSLPDRQGQPEISLAVHEQGEGQAVVFCHGFPELAYSWRHQLPAVAAAGFRAIAPDQRGYGGSTRPEKIEDYSLTHLTADLAGMLDALEIEKAVFVGHDWGGFVAWAMPLLYPERTAGVVGVCTPYVGIPNTQIMRSAVGGEDDRYYILWFQPAGVAEDFLDRRVRLVFDKLLRGGTDPAQVAESFIVGGKPDMNPFKRIEEIAPIGEVFASESEIETYVASFEATGFRGGINWYRNIDRNADEHPELGKRKLDLPCLMLTAEWDLALRPEMAAGMPAVCSDLETHMIEKAGHWVQQECPEAVNRYLVAWLERRL